MFIALYLTFAKVLCALLKIVSRFEVFSYLCRVDSVMTGHITLKLFRVEICVTLVSSLHWSIFDFILCHFVQWSILPKVILTFFLHWNFFEQL